MDEYKDFDDLLDRFFTNRTTPEESALVRQWLMQLDLTEENVSDQQLAAIKTAMYERIIASPVSRQLHRRAIIRKLTGPARWVAAACVILLAGVGVHYVFQPRPATATLTAGLVREVNDGTSVRHIRLKDSSDVWLNAHSAISYRTDFDQQDRSVRLEGEGFFDVTPDRRRPFIVSTGNIKTQVLGTSFDIENYADESEIRVALTSGKVRLSDSLQPGRQLTLAPNETMRYSRGSGNWENIPMDLSHAKDWTTGSIVFKEVPLAEALQRLAFRYNLHFQYSFETVAGKRVSTVLKNASWQSVLSDILFVHHLQYTQSNGVISIN